MTLCARVIAFENQLVYPFKMPVSVTRYRQHCLHVARIQFRNPLAIIIFARGGHE